MILNLLRRTVNARHGFESGSVRLKFLASDSMPVLVAGACPVHRCCRLPTMLMKR